MRENEENFDELKNLRPLSAEARNAYDQVYNRILEDRFEKNKSWKNRHTFKPYFVLAMGLLIILTVVISPIGKAISEHLGFGGSASKTLNNSNFITKQGTISKDKGISVRLEQVYTDQKESGFQFNVSLPKESKLLNKKIDEFTLNFALVDSKGEILMNLNSGKENEDSSNKTASYTGKSYIDREERTIEFTYRFFDDLQKQPDFTDTHILVTKITGANSNSKKVGHGLETQRKEEDYAIEQGEWQLPIKADQVKKFPSIKFTPVEQDLRKDLSATATPTSFIVDINVRSGIGKGGNPENMWLSTSPETSEERRFNWREAKTYKKNNQTYYRIIFDYPNYDSTEELFVHFPGSSIILEKAK